MFYAGGHALFVPVPSLMCMFSIGWERVNATYLHYLLRHLQHYAHIQIKPKHCLQVNSQEILVKWSYTVSFKYTSFYKYVLYDKFVYECSVSQIKSFYDVWQLVYNMTCTVCMLCFYCIEVCFLALKLAVLWIWYLHVTTSTKIRKPSFLLFVITFRHFLKHFFFT